MSLPQERLNQIAERKLTALGVRNQLTSGRIQGELSLTTGRVSHPATGAPLHRAVFRVLGHDRLQFSEGPFSGLEPVLFYDLDSAAALEARVLKLLQQRVMGLRELDAKLRTIGVSSTLDVATLRLRAVVKALERDYELSAGPEGVQVVRVLPREGMPLSVPDRATMLPLEELTTSSELDLFLEHAPGLKNLSATPISAPTTMGSGPATQLRVLPSPPGILTLNVLARLAEPGVYMAGIDVVMDLEADGKRYRFTATPESGNTFSGKLVGPTGERWKERFDAARFPGVLAFVRTVLGLPAEAPTESAKASATPSSGRTTTEPALPAHLVPHPGETWVMNVLIERDEGEEIRYTCTDIDGHPYGAARILKKADFQAVFAPHGTGWRLRIRIAQLEPDGVTYNQLSPRGDLSPNAKKIPLSTFASNFLPEAADY